MIMKRRNLDFEKHCKVPFGAYVQASVDNNPKNNNKVTNANYGHKRHKELVVELQRQQKQREQQKIRQCQQS